MVRAYFDISDAIRALEEAVEDAVRDAVREHAARIADAAKGDHPYTDRTGDLTASIRAYAPRALGTAIRSEVVADMPYADYVERRRPFAYLGPASDRVEPYFEFDTEARMTAAARGAGW